MSLKSKAIKFATKKVKKSKAGKKAMEDVKKWFSDAYKSVTKTFSNIGSWFRETFQTAWKNIKSVFSSWGSFFGGLWNTIKNTFSNWTTHCTTKKLEKPFSNPK